MQVLIVGLHIVGTKYILVLILNLFLNLIKSDNQILGYEIIFEFSALIDLILHLKNY